MLIYLWSNSLGDNWFSVQRAKSEQTSKKTKQGVTWVQTLKTLLLNPKRARYGLGFALSAFPISTLLHENGKEFTLQLLVTVRYPVAVPMQLWSWTEAGSVRGELASTLSEHHHFCAPSSKLGQNWLRTYVRH